MEEPVACRGCWMPGAKEVIGCPRKYFLFVYSSRKISGNFLGLFTKIFPIRLLKSFSQHFSLFRISCQISRKFAPWMPPSAASRSGNDIFLFFFVIYLLFLWKLAPCMPPRVDARGRRTVRTPFCTPLGGTIMMVAYYIKLHQIQRIGRLFGQIVMLKSSEHEVLWAHSNLCNMHDSFLLQGHWIW